MLHSTTMLHPPPEPYFIPYLHPKLQLFSFDCTCVVGIRRHISYYGLFWWRRTLPTPSMIIQHLHIYTMHCWYMWLHYFAANTGQSSCCAPLCTASPTGYSLWKVGDALHTPSHSMLIPLIQPHEPMLHVMDSPWLCPQLKTTLESHFRQVQRCASPLRRLLSVHMATMILLAILCHDQQRTESIRTACHGTTVAVDTSITPIRVASGMETQVSPCPTQFSGDKWRHCSCWSIQDAFVTAQSGSSNGMLMCCNDLLMHCTSQHDDESMKDASPWLPPEAKATHPHISAHK